MLSKVVTSQLRNNIRAFSTWSKLEAAPADPILGLSEMFKKETNPKKQLLGAGVYRDDDNKPYVLNCIRAAEKLIVERKMDHEYAGIQGLDNFVANSLKIAYGENSALLKDNRVAGCQSLSGTGSLRLGFEFLSNFYPVKGANVYTPTPTWPVHNTIPGRVGLQQKPYRYYNPKTKGLDLTGMLEDLDKAANESIVLFHVCAHNPTGVDPNPEQWGKILELVKRKQHFILFDSAYQGFASGDLKKDAYPIDLFTKSYDRLMLCQSFAKNFGVYGERAGTLSVVTGSK